jgi:hypothetical protein
MNLLGEDQRKLYKSVLKDYMVPAPLVAPPIPGSAGWKQADALIKQYIVEEHNAERLEGVVVTGKKGKFPPANEVRLVFPFSMYF